MSDFMNKHVLVTGGSSGIGLGIALGFARAGAKVTITARTPSRIDSAIGLAAEQGLRLRGLTCNVSHAEEVKACVAEAAQQWGGLDIVCCNAGIFPSAPLADMSEQQWDEVQAINSKGTFLTVQAALPWLKRAEYGRIILTSSITGPVTGYPGWAHYAASKAAQLGFMRSAALELAGDNINRQCRPAGEYRHGRAEGYGRGLYRRYGQRRAAQTPRYGGRYCRGGAVLRLPAGWLYHRPVVNC